MGRTYRNKDPEEQPRNQRAPESGLPFTVTAHAVDRFAARVVGNWPHAMARRELEALARSARRTEDRTPLGDEVWEATDGDPVRFVVKMDAQLGHRVCVTLLESRHVGGAAAR